MENDLKDFTDKQEAKTETAEKPEYKEITLKFGKNFVGDEFQGKDGNTYRQIMIPPNEETKQPWQSFVVRANQVHENQFGKGMWCKLPENGSTTVTKNIAKGVDENGKTIWENEKTKVPNRELKSMVEAYKTRDKAQENTQEEAAKPSLKDKIEKKAKEASEKEAKAPKKTKSKAKEAR